MYTYTLMPTDTHVHRCIHAHSHTVTHMYAARTLMTNKRKTEKGIKYIHCRPIGRGGLRGFTRTPLLTSKRFYMHRLRYLTVSFKSPTV